MFSNVKTRGCFPAALNPEERKLFAFDPESIDWWDYWINVHIPALRRWCYPLMEGRPLESRQPRQLEWGADSIAARAFLEQGRPPKPMAIFLTGSTGYLGSYLAAGLLSGHRDSLNLLCARNRSKKPRTLVAVLAASF